MLAQSEVAFTRDTRPYSSIIPFLAPPFLQQRRLLIVARHLNSSQTVHDISESGEEGMRGLKGRDERVKHNCRSTIIVIMGNAHTMRLSNAKVGWE